MSFNWIKIYDAPIGGNELSPHNLYTDQTVYVDISELPTEYEFVAWKDLHGNILDDTVIRLVEGGRYETSEACNYGFVAYVRSRTEEVCLVVVDCDETRGVVFRSDNYSNCNEQVHITAVPKCCYKFDSWSDSGSDNRNAERDVLATNGVNTYTASFVNENYGITVDVNDSTLGCASVSENFVTCGDMFICTATPNLNNVFDRWEPGGSIENPMTVIYGCGDPQNYMAYFSEIPIYELTYVYNSPNVALPDEIDYFSEGDTVVYRNASNRDYEFLGWAYTNGATQADIYPGETGTYMYGGNKTIYGVWQHKEYYSIHYYGTPDDPSVIYSVVDNGYTGDRITLYTPPAFTNYIFLGWQMAVSGVQPVQNSEIITGVYTFGSNNIDAYAVWGSGNVSYKLTYIYNDGTVDVTTFSGIQAGTLITVKSPQEIGINYPYHTFTMWYGNGATYSSGSVFYFPTNDVSLSAGWNENTVTVTYNISNADAGSTVPPTQTVYSGQEVVLNDGSSVFKTDYVFNGWTETNGGSVPLNSPITVNTSIVLYPVWKPVKIFTVKYIPNICISDPLVIQYTEGDIVTVINSSCSTESGCVCSWWMDQEGMLHQSGSVFQIHQNMIMTEYWDCCDITFFTNNSNANVYINGSVIPWGDPINIDDGSDFSVSTPMDCCFGGLINMDDGKYIQPCDSQNYTYRTIPSSFANNYDYDTVTFMNDADFINEINDKTLTYTPSLLIMNIDTGEIRQAVSTCEPEEYDLGTLCDGRIYVVVNCGTYEEVTQDEHTYVEVHEGDFSSIYEYIDLYGRETPSSQYVLIKIRGVNRYYIYTPCES